MKNHLTRRHILAGFGAATMGLRPAATAPAAEQLSAGGGPFELVLTPMSNRTLRVSLLRIAESRAEPIADDPAIVRKADKPPILRIRSLAASRVLQWGGLKIRLSPSPLRIAVENARGEAVQTVQFNTADGAIGFGAGRLPLFGLGEGGPQYDRRGHVFTMRNGQYNPDQRIEGGRMPIPWVLSPEGWAIFIHQPFGVTDLTGESARFTPQANSPVPPVDLFLMVGPEPTALLQEYAELTGRPHLPPLWSFGFLQSHRTLASRDEVIGEAGAFRDKKLPCDGMIYLGTGFCPSGWNTGHGSFEFNRAVFPDPGEMIHELHAEHFKVVLHLTKPPQELFGRVTDTGAAAQDANDAAHYWATHLDVFRLGVDGWWPDEGDGLSPASRLARDRMYWEGPIRDRPGVRPFALNRNGYAGIQQFGWLWTGDVNSDWKALAAQIPVGINTGLSGMPWWGTDTGGFVPTREFTGELFVRWFQFSAFCPLFRCHGRNWKMHLPWGWNTGDYGPIETDPSQLTDKANLHNAAVEPICRQYLNLRYQMLPYIYSAARESHETGMPLIRALWLHYPDDPQARERGDQYLWGRDLLVAPVIEPGAASRRLYLPRGAWYDFWSTERVEGGREITREVDLATMPLYVRAGTILPLGPVKQYVDQAVDEPLRLRIYRGADARYVLYEDDGATFAYEHGAYTRLTMHWDDAGRTLTLALAPGSTLLPPRPRPIAVEFADGSKSRQIEFAGKPLRISL
jgi:alpha-glucosidase (family GH31 glycosyl hydrolase)